MFVSHRYLKHVFPKAEETIILDILEQSDNNVLKASEKLLELGYEKKNTQNNSKTPPPKKEEDPVLYFFKMSDKLLKCLQF